MDSGPKKLFCWKKNVESRHKELFTHGKTFHRVFTAVDRDRITSRVRLIHTNKIFCTTLFWCSLKRSSELNWRNCLLGILKMLLENRFTLTYRSNVYDILNSYAITPRWLDDAKECIQSAWSKQRDYCSLAQKIKAADSDRFESCISRNYLEDSTWILNGSSIEYH